VAMGTDAEDHRRPWPRPTLACPYKFGRPFALALSAAARNPISPHRSGRGEGREVVDRDSQHAWRRRLPWAPLLLCPLPPPLKSRSRMGMSQGWPSARASGRRAAVSVAARRNRGRAAPSSRATPAVAAN
jgi:hypothetical protein